MGGYRANGGRKKGSGGAAYQEARDLLSSNSLPLIQKAIKLALDKKSPNTAIMSKLLDKLLPTLTIGSLEVDAKVKGQLQQVPEDQLKKMIKMFSSTPTDKIKIKDGKKKI